MACIGAAPGLRCTVHRAALRAAVERAELAGGISGVFVDLARRSQVLVHRRLSLLDSMERRSDDPDELSDLFRLGHLTTRMRRHAESLIILPGAAPGRAWRMPVSPTNVVRAAVSEVEDYARVEVRQLPDASVTGAAVAELAAGADLPAGVVRVLLGDLLELGRVTVSRPVPPAQLPDERVLREVNAGPRALERNCSCCAPVPAPWGVSRSGRRNYGPIPPKGCPRCHDADGSLPAPAVAPLLEEVIHGLRAP